MFYIILLLDASKEGKQREDMTMKKNNIDTFLIELEKNNETFKKWGDLYRIEENIINTIISTRKKKGLTQKEVAEMTGLKQPAIARIENNVNSPQLDTLIKILDALDLKIEINSLKTNKIFVDKDIYQNVVKEVEVLYSKEENTSLEFYRFENMGGIKNESNKYKYPCDKNRPA